MNEQLKDIFAKLISRHYNAVKTDTLLEETDNWKLEKRSRLYWTEYHETEAEFKELLSRCVLQEVSCN
jgi:hypothetical protein